MGYVLPGALYVMSPHVSHAQNEKGQFISELA